MKVGYIPDQDLDHIHKKRLRIKYGQVKDKQKKAQSQSHRLQDETEIKASI